MKRVVVIALAVLACVLATVAPSAAMANWSGPVTVAYIESWGTAFNFAVVAADGTSPTLCSQATQGQVALVGYFSESQDFIKNMYATVLAAKLSGRTIQVVSANRPDNGNWGCQVQVIQTY